MKKALLWLDRHFEEVLMSVSLCGIVIMMTIHVFCRYVLRHPLTWTEETTRYMFIWFVFMGVSYGIRNGTHIRVNILEVFFPKIVPVFSWIQDIVSAAFIFYMIPAAIAGVRTQIVRHQISAGLHMPMQFVYGSLMLALFLSVIRIIQRFILRITAKKETNQGGAAE